MGCIIDSRIKTSGFLAVHKHLECSNFIDKFSTYLADNYLKLMPVAHVSNGKENSVDIMFPNLLLGKTNLCINIDLDNGNSTFVSFTHALENDKIITTNTSKGVFNVNDKIYFNLMPLSE